MPVMPLGLACVKQAVEQAGHRVLVLNLMSPTDTQTRLDPALLEFQPEVIGVSVRNIDDQSMRQARFLLPAVKEVVDICRKATAAPIVLGGAGYSIFPQAALFYLGADIGIQGEGEGALVELLTRLEKKQNLEKIPGLFLRDQPGQVPDASNWKKPAQYPLPIPDSTLTVHPDFKPESVWLPFQTRRGCPMGCSYCSTAAIEGRRLRKRPLDAVISALQRYVAAGFDQFFITDNTFNFPLSYAKAFCREIIRRGLKIKWQAILYPLGVDAELVDLLARSGCVQVSLGFESGAAVILKQMNKRFSPRTVMKISELLKARGIRRMGFLLLGGPGETRETVMESLAFAEKLAPEMLRFTVGIRIYPHTALERTARSENLILPEDDLLLPRFFLQKELSEWLPEKALEWANIHPDWIFS